MKKVFFFLLISLNTFCWAQTQSLDSLKSLVFSEKISDSLKQVSFEQLLFTLFGSYEFDSLKKFSELSESFSRKINDSSLLSHSLYFQGVCFMSNASFNSALHKFKEALPIYENLKSYSWIIACKSQIASLYTTIGQNDKAIKTFKELIKASINENSGINFFQIINFHLAIGDAYSCMNKYNKARKHLSDALELSQNKDSTRTFDELANSLYAFTYLEQAGVSYTQSWHGKDKSNPIYISKKRKKELLDSAFYYLEQAKLSPNSALFSSTGHQQIHNFGFAAYFLEMKKFEMAQSYLNKINKTFPTPYSALAYFEMKSEINKSLENFELSSKYLEKVIELKDSLKKLDAKDEIVKFEFEIKQKLDSLKYLDDIKLEQQKTKAKEEELKAEKRFELGLEIGIFIILISLYFIYKQLKTTKIQKALIEEKQIEITDSINYAKKIQDALLISTVSLKEFIPESFIFFKPKDIVSGDFYWIHKNNNGTIFFTVADCTGHGVPGAFMSMIGNSLLNENIIENKIEDTGLILDNARASIIKSLHQKDLSSESRDGMDMALCKYNPKNKTVEYSGANNPLIHISGETINKIRGDSQPIGIYSGELKSFKTNKVKVKEGDMLYLFSDGFHDQFGGEKGKKYMSGKFYKFLLSISKENTEKQSKLIENEFERWRGAFEQIDDVCVMGVRVS